MLVWVERWLSVLTDQERMIIRLRFWEGMKGSEIAEAMNISPEAKVYTLLQKGLAHLREQARATYRGQKQGSASVSHIVKGQRKSASRRT
jgi:DNA-directed RNA polymerase specialized sigma24 family protein